MSQEVENSPVEVHKYDKRVRRPVSSMAKGGRNEVIKESDDYYMLYFPNGNSIRVREKELKRLGFHKPIEQEEPVETFKPMTNKERVEAIARKNSKHTEPVDQLDEVEQLDDSPIEDGSVETLGD